MAINENLIEAIGFNPTKETYTASVLDLCKEIESQSIVLPLYQTGIRWIDAKFVDLLNFQLLGKAPVAPISMNLILDSKTAVPQVTFINRDVVEESVQNKKSVTDGQQRLSCNFYAYSDDDKFKNIVLDLEKGCFRILDIPIKKYQIPVGKLLNKEISILNKYKNSVSYLKKDNVTDLLYAVRSKIFNYSYTINTAKNLTEEEQLEWFEVLNNAGSKISALQMKFSKFLVNGLDIHTAYIDLFNEKISKAGMDDAYLHFETRVSFPIASLNSAYEVLFNKGNHVLNFSPFPSDTKETQLCSLSVKELKQCIDLTLVTLDEAIEFIQTNDLSKPKRMDYLTYVAGVFAFAGNKALSAVQKNNLINWYKTVEFTNKNNQNRRKIFDELLKAMFS